MSAATAVLRWLLDRLPHDELSIDGQPYMRRYYLAGYAPPPTCRRCDGSGIVDDGVERILDLWCPTCDGTGVITRGWWWRWSVGGARVHEILTSDDQRAFHDHPWDFMSIGLHGTYVEERPGFLVVDGGTGQAVRCAHVGNESNPRCTYRAPWLLRRAATDLHSLVLPAGPVWTLVVMGPKRRTWGFADPDGWVGWREFDERHPGRDAVVVDLEARR